MKTPTFTKKTILFATFIQLAFGAFSQKADSTARILNFKGDVSVTNNGFSLIPTFSLGEPATIARFSVSGKKRFSFEPEFRYSLEGKPWSLIFIWRYLLVKKEKFQIKLGTHLPTLNFRTIPVIKDSVEEDVIQARRFFPVTEVIPTYSFTKNISMGIYYLYGRGIEKDLPKNTNFVSLRVNFNYIPLFKQFYLKFYPQFYYLKLDARDGYYIAPGLTLAREGFPLSISTLMNKPIQTDIAGKGFDWNVGLVYSFGRNFTERND